MPPKTLPQKALPTPATAPEAAPPPARSSNRSPLASRTLNVAQAPARHFTALYYGETKGGKTHMISTYPGPILVLAVGKEHGSYPTLRASGRDDIHLLDLVQVDGHPDPAVYGENAVSMEEFLDEADSMIRDLKIKTLACDTFSVYLEMWANWATDYGAEKGDFDTWRRRLAHAMEILDAFHRLPCNIIWTTHVDALTDGEDIVTLRPALPGKIHDQFLRCCNVVAFLDSATVYEEAAAADAAPGAPPNAPRPKTLQRQPDSKTVYRMWLHSPKGRKPELEVGTHFNELLPAPVYPPSYAVFKKRLIDEAPRPVILG